MYTKRSGFVWYRLTTPEFTEDKLGDITLSEKHEPNHRDADSSSKVDPNETNTNLIYSTKYLDSTTTEFWLPRHVAGNIPVFRNRIEGDFSPFKNCYPQISILLVDLY